MTTRLFDALDSAGQTLLAGLDTPFKIQAYLDSLPYIAEELDRTPLQVMQDRQCHCLDGALLAAAALRRLGFAPRLIDLRPDPGMDDDHVLAIYQIDGCYGAVAKSNYPGLRFREAVHRSLRELVITYFEGYFSIQNEKTLRAYTRPLNLTRFDALNWETNPAGTRRLIRHFYTLKSIPLITPQAAARLSPMDERALAANLVGVNLAESFGNRPGTH